MEDYQLHPIDDSIAGDPVIGAEVEKLKAIVTQVVFASRGYSIDQPLANLTTDAFRKATQADAGFNANGAMRPPLLRGKSGLLTAYDIFAVAPLGAGVIDHGLHPRSAGQAPGRPSRDCGG